MTLALLLTAVTGAWADDLIIKELTVPSEWNNDDTPLTVDEMTGFKDCSSLTEDEAKALLNSVPADYVLIIYGAGASSNSFKLVQKSGADVAVGELALPHSAIFGHKDKSNYKYYYTASDAIEVTPGSSANTWTFEMPGSDVVLTPIYANAAAFATTGTGSEATTLLPAAAEGVIAGTDASLIADGTGIVANIGETTTAQGTLMYAIGTSATQAPELTAFNATVPTAAGYDDAATVYVWYYIQGANAPEGEAATLDNTFNDTEPACLTVQVLTNKFDITFNAANANTIEAGKATVTVDGTDKTVTEGKLQGVKMGSEVKLKANPGYKFRKVEVKKAASAPTLKDALADGATVVITYTWFGTMVTTFTYTNNGGNYTGSTTGSDAPNFSNGMSKDGTTLKFTASNPDFPDANVSIDFYTDTNEYSVSKGSSFTSFTISVNGTDVTSQLTKVK